MEKHIQTAIDDYVTKLKEDIKNKALALQFDDTIKVAELIQYTFDYQRLTLQKNDFLKRKRVQNSIPEDNRCIACRANGEQCTRRKKKDDPDFCGTHTKGTPHGVIKINAEANITKKIEVCAEEINGIVYYIDSNKNVYKTEDILMEKENPQIIAQWEKRGNIYTIPEFGLV